MRDASLVFPANPTRLEGHDQTHWVNPLKTSPGYMEGHRTHRS